MAYGYSYKLPEGLTNEQRKKLKDLALQTARNASVILTGKFRKGWSALIKNNVLTVQNSVRYAIYLEMGTVYSRRHRYRVRDALNRVGFDTMKPQVTDPDIAVEIERANNPDKIDTSSTETGTNTAAGNIEGANPAGIEDILLPSDDPVDILITPVPKFADDIRPSITYKINTQQEAIEAYKKVLQAPDIPTLEDTMATYRRMALNKTPITDLFNEAALLALIAAYTAGKEEEQDGEDDLQSEVERREEGDNSSGSSSR